MGPGGCNFGARYLLSPHGVDGIAYMPAKKGPPPRARRVRPPIEAVNSVRLLFVLHDKISIQFARRPAGADSAFVESCFQ
jgi:hypothetical protein